MNILEDQVEGLNYLVDSPTSNTPSASMMRMESAESPRHDRGKNTSSINQPVARKNLKRKDSEPDEDANGNGAQTRAKRNRYISIACNECKRRKIKCNGNTPCQRCGNLGLECQYAPNCCTNGFKESEEFRQMNNHLASLQEQVDTLFANLNTLRGGRDEPPFVPTSERSLSVSQPPVPISPVARYRPVPRHLSFRGPTSSAFSLDVAKTTLHNMGYQGLVADEGTTTQDATPIGSPPHVSAHPAAVGSTSNRDPLWSISKEEAIRLCRFYEEEMGVMYPVVDIEAVITHGNNLFAFLEASYRNGLVDVPSPGKPINDEQSITLKMVIACAAATEGSGQSETAFRLFESVRVIADRKLHSEVVDIKDFPFLVLVAIYHFHCDEEALAWRIIGQVARMSIELGLHRRDSLFKVVTDEEERLSAIKLFWSIYVLDRRWSFGTGMPFALQDADIDPSLPEPDSSTPYLNTMIAYSKIGSKVWRSINYVSPVPSSSLNIEEIGYLDYQILQWQKSILPELQLPTSSSPQTTSRVTHRLQILLYLRANQMRILIYRPVLHSASSIIDHLPTASTVVSLAQDTIRALTHLNQTSDIYRVQQIAFNYFLISALAVIFLASCHAPVQFSAICRDEFYMALDLVKGFSTKSFVSKRLWKTIKGLKEVGPKLGLNPDMPDDAHSSAALAMAGLAGHEISNLGYAMAGQDGMGTVTGMNGTGGNSPMNGYQMSHEMTSLFEAALGNAGMSGGGHPHGTFTPIDAAGDPGSNLFGGDEELYRQLKDLF